MKSPAWPCRLALALASCHTDTSTLILFCLWHKFADYTFIFSFTLVNFFPSAKICRCLMSFYRHTCFKCQKHRYFLYKCYVFGCNNFINEPMKQMQFNFLRRFFRWCIYNTKNIKNAFLKKFFFFS